METPVGLTKDAGFQIGVRKTIDYPFDKVWIFFFSDEGVKICLGNLITEVGIKKPYHTEEGIEGTINLFKLHSHIRLTWKRKDWENFSMLQIRIIRAKNKTTISFHQDKMLDEQQREEMKMYWEEKIDRIEKSLR
jgi:hypothetical protein